MLRSCAPDYADTRCAVGACSMAEPGVSCHIKPRNRCVILCAAALITSAAAQEDTAWPLMRAELLRPPRVGVAISPVSPASTSARALWGRLSTLRVLP